MSFGKLFSAPAAMLLSLKRMVRAIRGLLSFKRMLHAIRSRPQESNVDCSGVFVLRMITMKCDIFF